MKSLLQRLIPDTHPIRLVYHRWRSFFAALQYGFPAKNMTVIAVTGTDGKTTTVAMVAHILTSAGIPTCAVSTAFFQINEERRANPTQKTSVDARHLQRFLSEAARKGCTHAVIEASSHGLLQGRLSGITPTIAALTNVSMEHLDYHGSMDEYIAAKGMLFRALNGKGTKVLNADDVTFFAYESIPTASTVVYSPQSDIAEVRSDQNGLSAKLKFGKSVYSLSLPLVGTFNGENALCALSCVQALGMDMNKAVASLKDFKGAGGRMQAVRSGQPFSVFVDFTVTPAAYKRTLETCRSITASGRVLVLTGSCGDRMKEKRPIIGRICGELADVMVVTNEDPYTEDPEKIIDEVLAGIPKGIPIITEGQATPAVGKFCLRISDRLKAIRTLLRLAKPGDTVLLCGKGADVTMMTKHGQIPWNEQEIVTEELRRKK